jgi:uncharacterized membrane protein
MSEFDKGLTIFIIMAILASVATIIFGIETLCWGMLG